MKKIISAIMAVIIMSGCFCMAFASQSGEVVIYDNSTKLPIVVASDAPETDKTAAQKLALYLKKITGADFETVNSAEKGIFIGKAADFVQLDGVKTEGYRILANGTKIGIAGVGIRGTIYGVYGFLREYCGCRWYSRDLIVTPEAAKIAIPADTDKIFNETFEYRETDWISPTDKEYSLANELNGGNYRHFTPAEGSNVNYIGSFCHTLATTFCSASKYFESQPELFALHNGKRTGSQLCLSNEKTYEIVLGEVMDTLRRSSDPSSDNLQILSLTQNDNQDYCECPACKAADAKYGSHAGSLLLFINRIAQEVENAGYKNVAVDTFAYQYTRKPPVGIIPRDNVIIRLCSIECCFCHPLDDAKCSENKDFMADLKEWSRLCNRLYIWDYTVNYSRTLITFSDFGVLQRNMQVFAENGVKGVYEEGAYYASEVNGEFADLRAYLLSRLLSDPYLDYEAEMNGFLNAYYGSAAPYIKEYLDILQKSEEKDHMPIYDSPDKIYKSLKKKDIAYIDSLWAAANAADGTPFQKANVSRSEISWLAWKAENKKGEFSRLQLPSVWMNANAELYDRLVKAGIRKLSEGSDMFLYDFDNMKFIQATSPYFWKQSKLENENLIKEHTNKYDFYVFAEEKFGFILKPIFGLLNMIF